MMTRNREIQGNSNGKSDRRAMKSSEKEEKFEQGLAHFNAREFFEAHEVWEEVWLVEGEPEKTFLQGIIQIAAAFHHYRRGNTDGAETLLAAGIVKITRFPPNIAAWRFWICGKKRNGGRERWAKCSDREMKGCPRFGVCTRPQRRLNPARAETLWFDDDLALHAFVAGTAGFAAEEGIGSRLGGFDIHRHGFAFLQFPAIFAEDERQARRRVGLGAVWKRVDMQPKRPVGRNHLQADFVTDFEVDYRGIRIRNPLRS